MAKAGSVYGDALYSLAREETVSHIILDQLQLLGASFAEEPDFLTLLSTPVLTKAERCRILDRAFRDRVHPYILNFMKLLTEKGYIRQFSHCVQSYREHYHRDNGILPVTVISAIPLSNPQAERLAQTLHHMTGRRIALTNQTDSSVLGGIRLDYEGKCADATLAHRLEAIRQMLQSTEL